MPFHDNKKRSSDPKTIGLITTDKSNLKPFLHYEFYVYLN